MSAQRDENDRDRSDRWVGITASEAFELLEAAQSIAFDLKPERIVGQPNNIELKAVIGERNMLRVRLWVDNTQARYELGVPFAPGRTAGIN